MATKNAKKNEKAIKPAKTPKVKNKCGCGCGVEVNRRFLPGHDTKLKSRMQEAFRTGAAKVEGTNQSPAEVAKAYGWEKYLTAAPPPRVRLRGKPVKAKVGRWEHEGVVVKGQFRWKDEKTGEMKSADKFQLLDAKAS